jgi:hypothetical protein
MKKIEHLKSAEFVWNPPVDRLENTEYIVKITGTAVDISSGKSITANTEFLLNVFIEGSGEYISGRELNIADNNTSANDEENVNNRQNILNPNYSSGFANVDLNLFFEQSKVTALARKKWKNKCIISGIDNRTFTFDSRPKIEVIPESASAEITYIGKDSIIIEGVTPSYGDMTVTLFVKRNDQQNTWARFKVEPLRISEPQLPKTMYPNVAYKIDPALPLTSFNKLEALLQNSSGTTVAYSQGEMINFTPSANDIGQDFVFFRKSDNQIYGQKYYIKIKDFEKPQIERLQLMSDKQIYVWTKSHGIVDGKENYVSDFVIEGNAVYSELAGQFKENKSELIWTQSFSFVPKDASKPFVFSISAKDARGNLSAPKSYPPK